MNTLIQDLRYGARRLRKQVGFTLIAVLTLSLGIGATTAIFSVVDGVLLRALPFPQSERIVQLREINERGIGIRFAEPNYLDVRARTRTFEAIAQYAGGSVVVSGGNETVRARAFWVSGDFFRVTGVQPAQGRGFLPTETKSGGAYVAVVSHSFWQHQLGGRADFNNIRLNVDGPAFTVIGVMPPGGGYPQDADIWVPREVEPAQTSRTAHNWSVVGRVKQDVTLAQARADVSTIGIQLRQEHGRQVDLTDISLTPLREFMTDSVRNGLWLMLAAVGLLLVVACANVANLILAQAFTRTAEFSVRAALGASRWRMTRQFITENLLLTVLACVPGMLISFWGLDLLLSLSQNYLPRTTEIAVNSRALLFTIGISLVIAVVLGLLPLLRFASADLHGQLKEAGRGQPDSPLAGRLREFLVIAQIALTLVLLIGAGLLGRSFLKLMRTETGFQPESSVVMTLSLPTTIDKEQEQKLRQFHEQLLAKLENLPGVISAGAINALPLTGRGANGTFQKDGNPATTGEADYRLASSGYFAALGIPLLQGRFFQTTDAGSAPDACVISQSLARLYWPGENPIGRTIQFGNMDGDKDLLHIVGIVGDIRSEGLDQPPAPTVYANSLQRPQWWQVSNQSYVVRAQLPAAALLPTLRETTLSLNRDVVLRLQTLPEVVSASLDTRRFSLVIFGVFAITALLLAAIGVYGVMSYAVTQRTHEIGVRLALGAQKADIMRLVFRQGMRLALPGVIAGFVVALGVTKWLTSSLHELSRTDPLTWATIISLLLIVAGLACWLPARRATKTDPMIALRCE